MSKTVFQRGREISLRGNAGTTRVFSDEVNKYPWMWKTVLVAGREFFRSSG
jgi:hypothetical protein